MKRLKTIKERLNKSQISVNNLRRINQNNLTTINQNNMKKIKMNVMKKIKMKSLRINKLHKKKIFYWQKKQKLFVLMISLLQWWITSKYRKIWLKTATLNKAQNTPSITIRVSTNLNPIPINIRIRNHFKLRIVIKTINHLLNNLNYPNHLTHHITSMNSTVSNPLNCLHLQISPSKISTSLSCCPKFNI